MAGEPAKTPTLATKTTPSADDATEIQFVYGALVACIHVCANAELTAENSQYITIATGIRIFIWYLS